jgi:hypothetical protein
MKEPVCIENLEVIVREICHMTVNMGKHNYILPIIICTWIWLVVLPYVHLHIKNSVI